MSNITKLGNKKVYIERLEAGGIDIVFSQNEALIQLNNSDLREIIEILQEAERLFGLQLKQPVNNGSIPRGFQSDERTGTI